MKFGLRRASKSPARWVRIGLAILAMACLRPASASAQPLEPLTFRLDYLPTGYHAPLFAAFAKGAYKAAGIDLKIADGKGSVPALQSVTAGNDMLVLANYASMVQSVGKGMPLIAVGGLIQRLPDSVVSLQSSSIHSVKDLEGKTMSIPPASAVFRLFPAFATAAGLDIKKIRMIQMDPSGTLTALLQGQVDFSTGWAFTDALRVASQKPINPPILLSSYGINVLGVGFVVTRDFAKTHGDLLRRFMAVTAQAYADSAKNPEAAVDALAAARTTVDRDLMLTQLKLLPPFLQTDKSAGHPFGWTAREDWEQTVQLLQKYFDMQESVDVASLYTNDFVPGH